MLCVGREGIWGTQHGWVQQILTDYIVVCDELTVGQIRYTI